MPSVIEINDLDQLCHYRLAWTSLLPRTPRASFFHTFDWLACCLKHYGDDRRFRVMVVRSGGEVIGIVPLCVETRRFRTGPVRVLTYPLLDWGCWYSPIGPNQAASMYLALQQIRQTHRDWDLIDLGWSDAATSAIPNAMRAAGFAPQIKPHQVASIIRIDGRWDDYLARQTKKRRHEMLRRLRLARRSGRQITLQRYRPAGAATGDGDPRWDLWEQCQTIASRSWQASSADGNTLSSPEVRDFLRDCHVAASRSGMLDVGLLKVDGQPAAFAYSYHYQGTITGLRIGYDPEFAKLGVGGTLLVELVRDSFRRGDRIVDFGAGPRRFKNEFRNATQQSMRYVYHHPSAWRAQGVRLTSWLKGRIQSPAPEKDDNQSIISSTS